MQICIIFLEIQTLLRWLVQQHRKSLKEVELAFSDHKLSQTIMLPQKQHRDTEICFKNGFKLPIHQENRVLHLNYSKWLEKSCVWNSCEVWRVSLAQGEIHRENWDGGRGQKDSMGEEESFHLLLQRNSAALEITEGFFVAPLFVLPCRNTLI